MLRYIGASVIANAFSATPTTQRSYRKFANRFETWRRTNRGLPDPYVERVRVLAAFAEGHLALSEGASILEIGTGWVHWETLIMSLVSGGEKTMFDVVDNRLFPVFKLYAAQLRPLVQTLGLPSDRVASANEVLDTISRASSFDEIYAALSWNYVVDESGTMSTLPSNTFDFIVSSDVLEHIDRTILSSFVETVFRLLKPGAVTFHSIDLIDHLSYFDPKAPPKAYYKLDGTTWDRWVNSKVQYINRVQRPEWLSLFEHAGFELVSEEVKPGPPGIKKIHASYSHLSEPELDTNILMLCLRKPA